MAQPRHDFGKLPSRALLKHSTTSASCIAMGRACLRTMQPPRCGFTKPLSKASHWHRRDSVLCMIWAKASRRTLCGHRYGSTLQPHGFPLEQSVTELLRAVTL